jgi:hypothetical protein
MPITIDTLNQADTEYLYKAVPEDPTDEQVTELARELLQRLVNEPSAIARAKVLVRRTANQRRESRVRQEATDASKSYTFSCKAPSSTGSHPVYLQVRVALRDMADFCRFHGLKVSEMIKLADGKIDDHRGWRLGAMAAAAVAKQRDSLKPGPALMAMPFGPAVRTTKEGMNGPVAPTYLPATRFVPGE